MKVSNTSERLQNIMNSRGLKQIDILNLAYPFCDKYKIKLGKSDLSQFVSGKVEPGQSKLTILGLALSVSEAWLMGYDVPTERSTESSFDIKYPAPNITENYTTFPVIGDIAAGYESIAIECWEGDTVDIPDSYLNGHAKTDFFVLRVKGGSMYPTYQDGDKVLILKQGALDHSGQIGAVLYDDECATLKKVEYAVGEDWMNLIPINPEYEPKKITGESLDHCKVIGIPKLLIRVI